MTGPDGGLTPLAHFGGLGAHVWSGTNWGITREAELYVYPERVSAHIVRYGDGAPGSVTVIGQSGGVVRVNIARLPPWCDTAVFVQDENANCVVAMRRSKRRGLLEALEEAGLPTFIMRRSIFSLYM